MGRVRRVLAQTKTHVRRSIAGKPRDPFSPIGLSAVAWAEHRQIPIGRRRRINLHMHPWRRALNIRSWSIRGICSLSIFPPPYDLMLMTRTDIPDQKRYPGRAKGEGEQAVSSKRSKNVTVTLWVFDILECPGHFLIMIVLPPCCEPPRVRIYLRSLKIYLGLFYGHF
ncbi:hypothetical protein AVEN_42203-1 [Araneus ventricosus]|uniref:Uncharacterized protein n=1 Tax=Araneus ventricosus TaxID=182803 RepID=A0A4Y2AZC9_ARAVE|nr:hypothetical protein AVEN_42203-1 [Araneus ventricosus]